MKLFHIFRFQSSPIQKLKLNKKLLPASFSCFCLSEHTENKHSVTELCSKILNICRKIKTEQSSSLSNS